MNGNCIALLTVLVLILFDIWDPRRQEKQEQQPTINRRCCTVSSIMYKLGSHARRAYRMGTTSFWQLHRLLLPFLRAPSSRGRKRKRGKIPNGPITTAARLSIALQYFAGGSPVDISVVHGVSHSEFLKCVWMVADAVNQCESLAIKFPTSHIEQCRIAAEFWEASGAAISTCIGAIDGSILI
jgi:hypothetical protein